MKYVRIEGGKVAQRDYTIAKLRRDNPDTSFGAEPSAETLAEFGVFILDETPPPSVTVGQVAEEEDSILVDGVWTQQWSVRSKTSQELAAAKLDTWERVKMLRDEAIDAGCTVSGIGKFDTDLVSRSNINGAATGAIIANGAGQPFEASWKLQDNAIAVLDGPKMIAVGLAVLNRTSACHAQAQQLGMAIEAAQSFADLEKIDIEKGWPSA